MINKLFKKIFATTTIFLLICFIVIPNIYGDINTKMGCYPSSNNVTIGDTFTVTTWLDANVTVDSWLVNPLSFNTTVLGLVNATQVTIGSFWNTGFYDTGTIDNKPACLALSTSIRSNLASTWASEALASDQWSNHIDANTNSRIAAAQTPPTFSARISFSLSFSIIISLIFRPTFEFSFL